MKPPVIKALLAFFLLASIGVAEGQAPFGVPSGGSSTPANTIPDALAKCRAAYDTVMRQLSDVEEQKLARPNADYQAALDAVLKQVAATGDLDAALQVKAEKDRIAKDQKLTDKAMQAMTPPLRAAYDKYALVIAAVEQQQAQLENAARAQYIDQLTALEKQLTVQMKFDDAQVVRAEKDRITAEFNAVGKTASAPTAPQPVPMDAATEFRMKGFFDILQTQSANTGVARNTLDKHDRGKDFKDVPKQGGLLVGLIVTHGDWFGAPNLHSVQPLFLTAQGEIQGDLHGGTGHDPVTLHAKPGYAIGAIWINDEQFLWALKVTYMKIDPLNHSLDPADSYDSEILGDIVKHPEHNPKKKLGGDGAPVIGIFGASGDEMNALGVVQTHGN
ncbi:MAG TPA: hypothetical protein VG733_17915 [Chthoniobacteraceae bacterium]|nr:hypothetical protein [Chthoniobacteraceae bacterium]